jgi:hypothetical protein
MNRKELRENALDILRDEYGLIDVIGWFDRSFLQGYTDAMVRVIPESSARIFRVYDGGYLEEIQYENTSYRIDILKA